MNYGAAIEEAHEVKHRNALRLSKRWRLGRRTPAALMTDRLIAIVCEQPLDWSKTGRLWTRKSVIWSIFDVGKVLMQLKMLQLPPIKNALNKVYS